MTVHPDYDGAHSQNDVAILVVDGTELAHLIQPITLNSDPTLPEDGDIVTVIGRGNTSTYGYLYEDVLRQVDLSVVPQTDCAAAYAELGNGIITDRVDLFAPAR